MNYSVILVSLKRAVQYPEVRLLHHNVWLRINPCEGGGVCTQCISSVRWSSGCSTAVDCCMLHLHRWSIVLLRSWDCLCSRAGVSPDKIYLQFESGDVVLIRTKVGERQDVHSLLISRIPLVLKLALLSSVQMNHSSASALQLHSVYFPQWAEFSTLSNGTLILSERQPVQWVGSCVESGGRTHSHTHTETRDTAGGMQLIDWARLMRVLHSSGSPNLPFLV